MKISISKSGSGAHVGLAGSMYVENAAELREKLIGLLEDGVTSITLDFSALDYIDSSGLGVLISIHKRTLQKGGRMTIHGLRGMVEELFKLTRLDLVFNIPSH